MSASDPPTGDGSSLSPSQFHLENTLAEASVHFIDVDTLGRDLAALEVVSAATFQTLAESNGHDTAKILESLEEQGAVTPFQRQHLAIGELRRLVFDDYLILDQIGSGGMGEVFKARNRSLDRIEAMKTIHASVAGNTNASKRFHREAKVLAKLEHPSIVPIYKVGHFDGIDYIAMKFIEGEDLRKTVENAKQNKSPISIQQACEWIRQAASALAHAHAAGIVHRDIKPGNLMVTPEGRLYVLDMGIARLIEQEPSAGAGLTRQSASIGTPEFMPPEQWADGSAATPASDIYALGATLNYLLAGRPPFEGPGLTELMQAHASKIPLPPSQFRTDVPKQLDQILSRMLAKRPQDRYASAREVEEALAPYAEGRIPPVSKPSSSRWGGVVAAIFVLGLGMWAGSQYFPQGKSTPAIPKMSQQSEAVKAVEPTVPVAVGAASETLPAWVAAYEFEHALDWGDERNLAVWLREKLGSKALPAALDEKTRALLDDESARRQNTRIDRVVAEFAASLTPEQEAAWSDRSELREFIEPLHPLEHVTSAGDLDDVRAKVIEESNALSHPFDGLTLDRVSPAWAKDWATSAVATLELMASLHAQPKDTQWKFEAMFLDESNRPVSEAAVRQSVTLAYTSALPAYLTIMQWDDASMTSVVLRGSKEASAEPVKLSKISFDVPGTKEIFLYATDRQYFEESVSRIEANPVRLPDLFARPSVVNRLRESFRTAAPLAGVEAPTTGVRWTRSVARLVVR